MVPSNLYMRVKSAFPSDCYGVSDRATATIALSVLLDIGQDIVCDKNPVENNTA